MSPLSRNAPSLVRLQTVKAHKEAVGNFALRLQQLGSMVGRLVLLPGMSAGPLSPEQLPALKALLDRALVEVKVWQGGGARGMCLGPSLCPHRAPVMVHVASQPRSR